MLKAWISSIITWYMATLKSGGYPLIALLMAIESSIFPLPSELVIPPAAHLSATGQIALGIPGIVIAGTIGSWIGATVMYWAARLAGRPLFMRYGKLVFISPQKIEGAERWAAHYGPAGIFVSRLLPVVRHLIGIPAGVVKMPFGKYSLYTVLGSAIWCCVLAFIGVKAGEDEALMRGEMRQVTFWIVGALVVLGGLYYGFVHRTMRKKSAGAAS